MRYNVRGDKRKREGDIWLAEVMTDGLDGGRMCRERRDKSTTTPEQDPGSPVRDPVRPVPEALSIIL